MHAMINWIRAEFVLHVHNCTSKLRQRKSRAHRARVSFQIWLWVNNRQQEINSEDFCNLLFSVVTYCKAQVRGTNSAKSVKFSTDNWRLKIYLFQISRWEETLPMTTCRTRTLSVESFFWSPRWGVRVVFFKQMCVLWTPLKTGLYITRGFITLWLSWSVDQILICSRTVGNCLSCGKCLRTPLRCFQSW